MPMTREQHQDWQRRAQSYLNRAGIALTPEEAANIEIADVGLGEFEKIGLAIVTYINTQRVCAKELILFPGQTCPQHKHPPVGDDPGKEETFRCRWGEMYLYVPGEPSPNPKATPPEGKEDTFTVWHEIVLRPGDQYTLDPETWHWFQAGPEGAIVSEFSTHSTDENDLFFDEQIQRIPEIED